MEWLVRWLGFHVHKWGKWSVVGDLVRREDKSCLDVLQMRECAECGKKQYQRDWLSI